MRNGQSRRSASEVVRRDPEIHSGELVFTGTRVPVANLIEMLGAGRTIEEFLNAFPTVRSWQVEAYLESSAEAVWAAIERDIRGGGA